MRRNAAVGLFTKPSRLKSAGYGLFLITSTVLDARRRGAKTEAYGVNTPQGGANEGNAADDALLVIRISLCEFPTYYEDMEDKNLDNKSQ